MGKNSWNPLNWFNKDEKNSNIGDMSGRFNGAVSVARNAMDVANGRSSANMDEFKMIEGGRGVEDENKSSSGSTVNTSVGAIGGIGRSAQSLVNQQGIGWKSDDMNFLTGEAKKEILFSIESLGLEMPEGGELSDVKAGNLVDYQGIWRANDEAEYDYLYDGRDEKSFLDYIVNRPEGLRATPLTKKRAINLVQLLGNGKIELSDEKERTAVKNFLMENAIMKTAAEQGQRTSYISPRYGIHAVEQNYKFSPGNRMFVKIDEKDIDSFLERSQRTFLKQERHTVIKLEREKDNLADQYRSGKLPPEKWLQQKEKIEEELDRKRFKYEKAGTLDEYEVASRTGRTTLTEAILVAGGIAGAPFTKGKSLAAHSFTIQMQEARLIEDYFLEELARQDPEDKVTSRSHKVRAAELLYQIELGQRVVIGRLSGEASDLISAAFLSLFPKKLRENEIVREIADKIADEFVGVLMDATGGTVAASGKDFDITKKKKELAMRWAESMETVKEMEKSGKISPLLYLSD